jgi:hypothetical protein
LQHLYMVRGAVCVLFLARHPAMGQCLLIHEVYRSHTATHHSWQDSSGRMISSSHRPLPDNTHNRKTSMPPVGFEPTISAGKRPQTYALGRAVTGTGWCELCAEWKIQTNLNVPRVYPDGAQLSGSWSEEISIVPCVWFIVIFKVACYWFMS